MIVENKIAPIFNEWMRRYTDEPERFEREFESVVKFLKELNAGVVPSYGDSCSAYMLELEAELFPGD